MNLAQEILEDKESVTNITGASMNLTKQVMEYANQMANKDSAMATMQNTIIHMQGGNYNPYKQAGGPADQENRSDKSQERQLVEKLILIDTWGRPPRQRSLLQKIRCTQGESDNPKQDEWKHDSGSRGGMP